MPESERKALRPEYGGPIEGLLESESKRGLLAIEPESKPPRIKLKQIFLGRILRDRPMARCVVALLYDRLDYLPAAHEAIHKVEDTTADYVRGILLRRAGEAWNSKYWLKRSIDHPVTRRMYFRALEILEAPYAPRQARILVSWERWDPYAFVDACMASVGRMDGFGRICRELQEAEWQLLFDYAFVAALSEPRRKGL